MRTIKVSLTTLRDAIARAHAVSDDWQAECCEIALIPAVAKRYAELNAPRLPAVAVIRHDGRHCIGMTPDDNRAVADWAEFTGYTLGYGLEVARWNSVRSDYYSHSPSTCWNGMSRETVSQFVHDLRMVAIGYDHPEHWRTIERAGIRVTGFSLRFH